MRLWPFRKQSKPEPAVVVPFPEDISELSVLKRHTLRALLGILADRHYQCRSPHPFCGDIQKIEGTLQFVAESALQQSPDGRRVIGIYLTKAKRGLLDGDREPETPFEYVACLDIAESKPSRKFVVQPMSDGTYIARYGGIVNPVEGDYSTGGLDVEGDTRTFRCNPEPTHAGWHYFDSPLDEKQRVVPHYHCAVVGQYWLIADVDFEHGTAEVAHLEVKSWPEHNYGIHKPESQSNIYMTRRDDDSEFSRTIAENLNPTLF